MSFLSAFCNLFSKPQQVVPTVPNVTTVSSRAAAANVIAAPTAAAPAKKPKKQKKQKKQQAQCAPKGGWLDAVVDSDSNTGSIDVYDSSGKRLTLGTKDERGSGGEGTVYELPMYKKFLVKIYKEGIRNDKRKMEGLRKRIIDMVAIQSFVNLPFMAWPIMPVMNSRKEIIGFVMHKCTGNSFLTLRGPRFIHMHFPRWTRRELALTALDYVKKIRLLADANVFVNDFNPANFLVNDKCEVMFIDCDSYQVPSKNGVHTTATFFPSHIAPELLRDKGLLAAPRNIHHVEFGAALTAFNILMCGMHPYSYFDANHKSACGTPEENLLKGHCPLLSKSGSEFPKGGWYAMWSWMPYRLKSTFIKMFKDGHANPNARPRLVALQANIEDFLQIMQREPERCEMEPKTVKSNEWKTASGTIVKH